MSEPLREIEGGVVWYFEGEDADLKVRQEGYLEIYPGWVRIGNGLGISAWVPRERVEQVHER
jgi:hypothetical protein